jgi:hypothetical protein
MAHPAGSLSSAVRHRNVSGLSLKFGFALVYKMEMWCSEMTMVGPRLRASVHHRQNLQFAFDSADTIARAPADRAIEHFGGGLAFIACFGDTPDRAAPPCRRAHPPAGVRRIVDGTGYSARSAIGRGPRRGRRGRCW